MLAPALAAAQPTLRLDVGLAATGQNGPYGELSATATTGLGGPAVLSVGVAHANKLFDVSYNLDLECPDTGSCAFPDVVETWTALSALGGVRLRGEAASFHVAAGPVLSIAEKGASDVLVGGGAGAEVGILDVYPVPSVGLGFSVHGATTTSHTWAGARIGARVRL